MWALESSSVPILLPAIASGNSLSPPALLFTVGSEHMHIPQALAEGVSLLPFSVKVFLALNVQVIRLI